MEYTPGILATDYAKQQGITPERVYQLAKEGTLKSYTLRHGNRTRLYVEPPPPKVLDAPSLSVEPTGQLTLLSDYNSRLVQPWAERVAALEAQTRLDAAEIGDLKRQVRQLRKQIDGLMAFMSSYQPGKKGDEEP